MAFNQATFGVIDQVLERVLEKQPKMREKANTVTALIGAVVTAVLTGIAYLVEAGTAMPEWTIALVSVLGLVGTVLGVNRTKNGFTQSQVQALRDEIQTMIDAQEGGRVTPQIPAPVEPVVREYRPQRSLEDMSANDIADELDELAKAYGRS